MSTSNNPSRRRRIAGERKPARVAPTGEAPAQRTPSPPPAETVAAATTTPPPRDTREHEAVAGGSRGPSNRLLVVLGAVALVLVVVASLGAAWLWGPVQEAKAVEATNRTAPSAAERAAVAVLSYDYRSLQTDKSAAVSFMTPAYAKSYTKTFDALVVDNATKLQAKVQAQVLGSGVEQSGPDRARVLLFVNQTTTSTANSGKPQVALNRVVLDMVQRDGTWLVDGITSY